MRKLFFALFIPLLLTVGCKKEEVVEPDYAKEIEGFYYAETISNDKGEQAKWNPLTDKFYIQVVYLEKNLVYVAEMEQFGKYLNMVTKGQSSVTKQSGLYLINPISENNLYENMKVQIGTNSFTYSRTLSKNNPSAVIGAIRIMNGKRF